MKHELMKYELLKLVDGEYYHVGTYDLSVPSQVESYTETVRLLGICGLSVKVQVKE